MSPSDTAGSKMVGMYVHQHWPYNHPYCARTWTLDDWRGYADGLTQLGYNAVLIWPMLEIIPAPPTPSDTAALKKISEVIDMLHSDFGMRVWIVLCPNVAPVDEAAASAPFEKRHFFYCDRRENPGDRDAVARLMARRETVLEPLREADG